MLTSLNGDPMPSGRPSRTSLRNAAYRTFRAGVILHETLHLIYETIDDAGAQRANDHCYEAFAMRAAKHGADPSDVRQCRPDRFP